MTRVKRGTISVKKRKKILKYTKGFKWGRKSKERAAREALLHAWPAAFVGRKLKKRNFRRLWQIQLNAAVREHGLTYSKFIGSVKNKKIALNRKVLAELAQQEPKVFEKIIEETKAI